MFPLAYAVVEGETKHSWKWSIELLKEDIDFINNYCWTFITDKQKSLVPAIVELCENSEHRCCVRHLYNNFKLKHKGLNLKDQVYVAARAYTVVEFKEKMEELKKMKKEAFEFFADKPPTQWSKSHFSTYPKTNMLLNNLCESFNSLILEARDKPVLTMLERIRCILMRRIHVNRDKMMKKKGLLCPKIQKILEKIKEEAAACVPDWGGTSEFQVMGFGGQFVCDLNAHTCSCRRWDLTGIPCKHAISAMAYAGLEPEQAVSHWYNRENYIKCYENYIHPLNGPQLWPKTGLLPLEPPTYSGLPSRHKKKRRLEMDEKKKKTGNNQFKLGKQHQQSLKCSNCGQVGHNKRSCKNQPQPQNIRNKRVKRTNVHANEGTQETQMKKLPVTRPSKTFAGNTGCQFKSNPIQTQGANSSQNNALYSLNWHGHKVYLRNSGVSPQKK